MVALINWMTRLFDVLHFWILLFANVVLVNTAYEYSMSHYKIMNPFVTRYHIFFENSTVVIQYTTLFFSNNSVVRPGGRRNTLFRHMQCQPQYMTVDRPFILSDKRMEGDSSLLVPIEFIL
jgi:hypothetical protein